MENENFVTQTENVEQTTEQTPKTYTEAEFNAKLDEVLGKKLARREAKIRKEYDRNYGELVDVLKAGTGKESVGDITNTFRDFYQKKGVQFAQKPEYTEDDIRVLAKAEAEDIIRSGYEDVVEEVDRLTDIGFENMTAREKAVFKVLADHRQSTERGKELAQIGVTEEEYNSKEFQDFAANFNPGVPTAKIFEYYRKTQPQKEIRTMGSMTNKSSGDSEIKDFYTPEEAKRFTTKDFDKNPALYKAVQNSMLKWK